jgi:glycerate-2-kinase
MRSYRYAVGVIISVTAAGVAATACTKSTTGHATHTTSGAATSQITTAAPSTLTSVAPTGQPVGTAVMKVSGGSAAVTIRYRINGGPEQTEPNVPLPWEKQYSVYNELESQVTADGGDVALTCTIIMDGDKLVSLKSEPRPTCSFAYWG